MSSPSRLTRAASQEQTRQRVLAAARAAFVEHGFHRASLEAIAAAAGYTRGAVYANFPGKEALFLAVLDEEMVARTDAMADAAAGAVSREGVARATAVAYARATRAEPGWGLALAEFTTHAARRPELAAQLRERTRGLITHAAARFEVVFPGRPRGDLEAAVRQVLAYSTGWVLESATDSETFSMALLEDAFTALLP